MYNEISSYICFRQYSFAVFNSILFLIYVLCLCGIFPKKMFFSSFEPSDWSIQLDGIRAGKDGRNDLIACRLGCTAIPDSGKFETF